MLPPRTFAMTSLPGKERLVSWQCYKRSSIVDGCRECLRESIVV